MDTRTLPSAESENSEGLPEMPETELDTDADSTPENTPCGCSLANDGEVETSISLPPVLATKTLSETSLSRRFETVNGASTAALETSERETLDSRSSAKLRPDTGMEDLKSSKPSASTSSATLPTPTGATSCAEYLPPPFPTASTTRPSASPTPPSVTAAPSRGSPSESRTSTKTAAGSSATSVRGVNETFKRGDDGEFTRTNNTRSKTTASLRRTETVNAESLETRWPRNANDAPPATAGMIALDLPPASFTAATEESEFSPRNTITPPSASTFTTRDSFNDKARTASENCLPTDASKPDTLRLPESSSKFSSTHKSSRHEPPKPNSNLRVETAARSSL